MEKDIKDLLDLNSRGIISDQVLLESLKKVVKPEQKDERTTFIEEQNKKAREVRERIEKLDQKLDRENEINNNINYLKGINSFDKFEKVPTPKYNEDVLNSLSAYELDSLVAKEQSR